MSSWSVALWALGLLAGLYVAGLAMTTHRLLRMRLGPIRYEAADQATLPAPIRALFARAARELEPLGFEPGQLVMMHGPMLDAPPTPMLWLPHYTHQTWAAVALAQTPTPAYLLRLSLTSYMRDGGWMSSVSGEAWAIWSRSPKYVVLDTHRPDWAAQLQDHLSALASKSDSEIERLALSEALDRSAQALREQLTELVPFGTSSAEASFGVPWRTALRIAARALFPSGELRQLRVARQRESAWEPEAAAAAPWVQLYTFRQLEALLRGPVRPSVARSIFLLTALLFVASALLYDSWRGVAQLTLVLLVHELGHWGAMRLFGYAEPAIFFVPFFGAATAGTKHDASLSQRLAVLAAGPLPGLLAGTALLFWLGTQPSDLRELAVLAVIVNAANLLPILPLDGGRFVQQLLPTSRPWLEIAMAVASVAAFVALAIVTAQPFLWAIAVLTALPLRGTYAIAQLLAQLRRAQPPAEERALVLWQALSEKRLSPATKMGIVRRVLERLHEPPSSTRARLLGGLAYAALLGCVGAGFVAVGEADRRSAALSYACRDFVGGSRFPADMPQEALGVTCESADDAQRTALRAQLEQFAAFPAGLCLRDP